MRKILVLRGGALGDFIVTLPALALLRSRWPQARIELIGNATAAQLARHRGLLDAVHSQHDGRWSALFGEAELPLELAAWLRDFDLVISYWPDPDGELARRFPLRDGQVFLSAAAMPTRAPAAAHYCEPLQQLGLEAREYFVRLTPVAVRASAGIAPPLPRPIAIHPGSGSPRKNWSAENWRTLIARLSAPVSLVLGEVEAEAWTRDLPPRVEVLLHRPLEELVAHFTDCRLFLGHDSGISHLAAACGVRCVLLFGPTAAVMWAPPAPNVRVLDRGPDLRAIAVDDVSNAVAAALADQN